MKKLRNKFFYILILLLSVNFMFPKIHGQQGASYYCDPVNGKISNNGSKDSPWNSLEDVMKAGKTFSADDMIYLMEGNHGYPVIKGINTGNVTITKFAGHNPEIRRLVFDGADNWTVKDIKITSNGALIANQNIPLNHPVYPLSANALVSIKNSSNNITIDSCMICSLDDNSVWTTADDWNYHAWNGIEIGGGKNNLIINNYIKNVNFGSWGGCTNYKYRNNVVENFCGDALQFGSNYEIIENNVFLNCYKVNGNHDDLMQGMHTSSQGYGTQIRGNILISNTDQNQPFKGSAQGIGLFDRMKNDYIIENNLVVVDHWHGITLLGATNCRVINNTVIDPNNTGIGPAWIQIAASLHAEDPICSGNIIRNNICNIFNNDEDIGIVENNITLEFKNYTSYFEDYVNQNFHTKAGSPAINTGTASDAPAVDIDGISRPQGAKIDIGCYEFDGEIIDVAGVTLSKTSLSIPIGETEVLTATVEPENANNTNVLWSSSNPTVAKVNNGTIEAFSEGSAVITVTTDEGGFTDKCNVTVTIPEGDFNLAFSKPVNVSDENLPDTPGTYIVDSDVNDATRWSAEGFPQNAVIDLGKMCNISSLLLYTYKKRAYQYVIEASTNGKDYTTIVDRSTNTDQSQPITDDVAATTTARYIKLTVTGVSGYTGSWVSINELMVMGSPIKTIQDTSIKLDQTSLKLDIGQTKQLSATVEPQDATNVNITWSSDNTAIATVGDDGLVTALKAGSCTITAESYSGLKAMCTIDVQDISSAINNSTLNEHILKAYPIPCRNTINIEFCNKEVSKGVVRILDMTGKELLIYNIETLGTLIKQLDLSGLKDGTYIISFSNGTSITNNLLIKSISTR